jgi:hypothetical protein
MTEVAKSAAVGLMSEEEALERQPRGSPPSSGRRRSVPPQPYKHGAAFWRPRTPAF